MLNVQTKLTAQGQVSVPAAIRHALGIKPGSVIEWQADGDTITVRRAASSSTEQIRQALFPEGLPLKASTKTPADIKAGIAQHMRAKYSR